MVEIEYEYGKAKIKPIKGTFMWVVREMKLGKKVRRNSWDVKDFYIVKYDDGYPDVINTFDNDLFFKDYEATDWEVVDDDKDWNLRYNGHIGYTSLIDLKKCRDLIIKDINIDYTSMCGIKQIINKRFGDL